MILRLGLITFSLLFSLDFVYGLTVCKPHQIVTYTPIANASESSRNLDQRQKDIVEELVNNGKQSVQIAQQMQTSPQPELLLQRITQNGQKAIELEAELESIGQNQNTKWEPLNVSEHDLDRKLMNRSGLACKETVRKNRTERILSPEITSMASFDGTENKQPIQIGCLTQGRLVKVLTFTLKDNYRDTSRSVDSWLLSEFNEYNYSGESVTITDLKNKDTEPVICLLQEPNKKKKTLGTDGSTQ